MHSSDFKLRLTGVLRFLAPAAAVAVVIAALNVMLLLQFDRTTYGTTNGIWKSATIRQWELGVDATKDSGGWDYYPLLTYFCKAIPDSWMQFGTAAPSVTFREIALLNCLLGGICAAMVFLLVRKITSSNGWAFAVVTLHAACAFILINSLNNEDIMPGYTCFLVGTVLIFYHVESRGYLSWAALVASAMCFGLMTLLHWTLLPPSAAGLSIVFAYLLFRRKLGWLSAVVFALCFCFALWQFFLPRDVDVSPLMVLYPNKAQGNAWVGFRADKLNLMVVGIASYFLGGSNTSDYHWVFATYPARLALSLTVVAAALLLCFRGALSAKLSATQRLLAAFGIVVFAVGQLENLYSQPQDPQMQIQPMLMMTLGFAFLGAELVRRAGKRASMVAACCVAAAGIASGAANLSWMEEGTPKDGDALTRIRAVNERFPPQKFLRITHGFDGWLAWEFAVTYQGDWDKWYAGSLRLIDPISAPKCDVGCAINRTWKEIDDAVCSGKPVYSSVLWNEDRETFETSMVTLVSKESADRYYDAMKAGAQLGEKVVVDGMPFWQVLRKPSSCPAGGAEK